MLKSNYISCSCPNQHQLTPGEICDICNGIIEDHALLETDTNQQQYFSFDYFEDLEIYLESATTHAA